MADLKISALTGASTPLAGTEVLPIVQSGSTVKVSVANLTAGRAVATAGGSFTDNITQSTAAKGINFTANTAAAGKTSQLLNWYEEGTWTPTRNGFVEVVGGGSITSTGVYTRVGNLVTIQAQIVCAGGATISATSGIGSYLSGLPFTPSRLGSGLWVNGSSVADEGGVLVHTNTNVYLTKGWVASSSTWYFSATYFV